MDNNRIARILFLVFLGGDAYHSSKSSILCIWSRLLALSYTKPLSSHRYTATHNRREVEKRWVDVSSLLLHAPNRSFLLPGGLLEPQNLCPRLLQQDGLLLASRAFLGLLSVPG